MVEEVEEEEEKEEEEVVEEEEEEEEVSMSVEYHTHTSMVTSGPLQVSFLPFSRTNDIQDMIEPPCLYVLLVVTSHLTLNSTHTIRHSVLTSLCT